LNLFADYYTGLKSDFSDAFSMATLKYAANGCESGIIGGIIGELILAPLIDIAAPYVARLFADEAGAAIKNAIGDMCDLCFPAGTLVHTKRGPVSIEKIKVGDEVLSRVASGKLEYKRVIALTQPHPDELLEVQVEGEQQPLRPTTKHPFWIKRGAQDGSWLPAGQIQVGDRVLRANGQWRPVIAVNALEGEQIVYNLEVDENHDFFVGQHEFLVHNGCASVELAKNMEQEFGFGREAGEAAHHIVAVDAKAAADARAVLEMEGIDVNSAHNGVFISEQYHWMLHTPEYYEAVNEALVNAAPGTVQAVLRSIANQIVQGTFPY